MVLLVIACIIVFPMVCIGFHRYVKKSYHHRIFSFGSLSLSCLGAILLLLASNYFHNGHQLLALILLALGCIPYIWLFIKDTRSTNITVAIIGIILRGTISFLIILAILMMLFPNREGKR